MTLKENLDLWKLKFGIPISQSYKFINLNKIFLEFLREMNFQAREIESPNGEKTVDKFVPLALINKFSGFSDEEIKGEKE